MRGNTHYGIRFLLGMLVFGLGCGPAAEPRQPLFGKVAVAGVEVDKGLISFFPKGETAGPVAITEITNGAYRFTTETGPYPGSHRVVIDFQSDPPLGKITVPAGGRDPKIGTGTSAIVAEGDVPIKRPPWETEFVVPLGTELRKDFVISNTQETPHE